MQQPLAAEQLLLASYLHADIGDDHALGAMLLRDNGTVTAQAQRAGDMEYLSGYVPHMG